MIHILPAAFYQAGSIARRYCLVDDDDEPQIASGFKLFRIALYKSLDQFLKEINAKRSKKQNECHEDTLTTNKIMIETKPTNVKQMR